MIRHMALSGSFALAITLALIPLGGAHAGGKDPYVTQFENAMARAKRALSIDTKLGLSPELKTKWNTALEKTPIEPTKKNVRLYSPVDPKPEVPAQLNGQGNSSDIVLNTPFFREKSPNPDQLFALALELSAKAVGTDIDEQLLENTAVNGLSPEERWKSLTGQLLEDAVVADIAEKTAQGETRGRALLDIFNDPNLTQAPMVDPAASERWIGQCFAIDSSTPYRANVLSFAPVSTGPNESASSPLSASAAYSPPAPVLKWDTDCYETNVDIILSSMETLEKCAQHSCEFSAPYGTQECYSQDEGRIWASVRSYGPYFIGVKQAYDYAKSGKKYAYGPARACLFWSPVEPSRLVAACEHDYEKADWGPEEARTICAHVTSTEAFDHVAACMNRTGNDSKAILLCHDVTSDLDQTAVDNCVNSHGGFHYNKDADNEKVAAYCGQRDNR